MSPQSPGLARSASSDYRLTLGPNLPALPERLLLAHAEGRVLFIAGAGVSMSAPSNLPDFGRLVRDVFSRLDGAIAAHIAASAMPLDHRPDPALLPPLDAEQRAMLSRIDAKEYDVALGILERRMDGDQAKESSVRRAVVDLLRAARSHAPIHTSLVRLADRGGTTTIVTTNFDPLLERAGRALRVPLQRYALHDIPRPSLRPEFGGVLHVHGVLDPDPRRHSDLILTDRDFGEHYMRRRAIPDLIYDAARVFHIVLVGYSLGDPPMRYLLNAVAADGQRFSDLKERFAFVGLDQAADRDTQLGVEAELATWRGRGITPIPYDKAGGHRAVADVLAAWADLSPHGRRSRAEGRTGRILRVERAAASEASASLFGHLFRRCGDEDQVRIAATARDGRADPAWLDGMLEIVRERGPGADREGHASRLCEVALHGRFDDRAMLRWAAELPASRPTERQAVVEVARRHLDRDVPEPWRAAWSAVVDAHGAPVLPSRRHQDYELGRRIRAGDRSGGLVAEVIALVAPRLQVEWRADSPWLRVRIPRTPRSVEDLLHRSVTSGEVEIGRGLSLDGVTEVPFLLELADALEAEVARGLHLARRIGRHEDRGFYWLGGLERLRLRLPTDDDDDADRYHRGIAPACRLLLHALARLSVLDPVAGRGVLRRWLTGSDVVYQRMWAAAAVEPALADGDEVGRFLLERTPAQTWRANLFPEVAELRARRFRDLGDADREAVIRGLLAAPPAATVGRRGPAAERRRVRTGFVVRELTRIEASRAVLPAEALRWLDPRREGFEEFVARTADAGLPRGVQAGWVGPSPDGRLDGLDGEALVRTADERLRAGTDVWGEPGRGVWDWLGVTGNPSHLARALLAVDGHRERYGKVWAALGGRHAPTRPDGTGGAVPAPLLDEAERILRTISEMTDDVFREAAEGLSDWLGRWARHLRGDPHLPVAIAKLWPFAARLSERSNDATDYEAEDGAEGNRVGHDSLNAPIGYLTLAFLGACPSLADVPRPFEDPGLRAVRDLVAETDGRAGLVARYGCITSLPYLLLADEAWATDVLLRRLKAGPESDVLWHGVAHSRATRGVMERVGRLMARRVLAPGLGTEVRRALLQRVCFATLAGLWHGAVEADLLPEVEQMLRSVPEDLRADGAATVERFVSDVASPDDETATREAIFGRAVEPFLTRVWPRERSAVTPAVAEAFASVPAASGRRLGEAVAVVRRFLVPFESWSMHDWGLLDDDMREVRKGVITGPEEAAAALELLDLTIGRNPDARVPAGLDAVLKHIASEGAALVRDSQFVRLATLARR